MAGVTGLHRQHGAARSRGRAAQRATGQGKTRRNRASSEGAGVRGRTSGDRDSARVENTDRSCRRRADGKSDEGAAADRDALRTADRVAVAICRLHGQVGRACDGRGTADGAARQR